MAGGSYLENTYALIVGISDYKDLNIRKLNFTRADAEGILKILIDPKIVGLKQDKIKVLLNEEATKLNIEDAISDWLFKKADKDSTVFVYFAGHGGLEEDRTGTEKYNQSYLLPVDTIYGKFFTTAISSNRFHELLSTIKSKKLVIFMDSCHAGGVCSRKGARDVNTVFDPYPKIADGEGRLVIAASQREQQSFEDDKLSHGIFTYHLIEGLSGAADTNNDGYVTVTEMYNYLAEVVPKTAMQLAGTKQEPLLTGDIKKDFVLTLNHERLKEIDQKNKNEKQIDELSISAQRLHDEGKYLGAIEKWNGVLNLDSGNVTAREGITKAEEKEKNKNLDRLLEWRVNKELTPELYDLTCRLIEPGHDELSEDDKKISLLLNDLLSDTIPLSRFKKDVERIKGAGNPQVKLGVKELSKEDEGKQILRLSEEAKRFFERGNIGNAIAKWKKIQDSDSENRDAIEGIKESERILKELAELNSSAGQLYNEGKYSEAIEAWNKVLNIDPKNQIAIDWIKKANNKIEEIQKNKDTKDTIIGGVFMLLIITAGVYSWYKDSYIPGLSVSQESFLSKDSIFLEENMGSLFKLSVSKSSSATLNWNVDSDQPWIIIYPRSGSNNGDVSIKISTIGKNTGNYNGNITITSNGGNWTKEIKLTILPSNRSPISPKTRSLGVNEDWDVERGYSLTVQFIDTKSTPKQVLLVLSRNGNKLDEKFLSVGETYNWNNIFITTISEIYSQANSDKVTLTNTTIS